MANNHKLHYLRKGFQTADDINPVVDSMLTVAGGTELLVYSSSSPSSSEELWSLPLAVLITVVTAVSGTTSTVTEVIVEVTTHASLCTLSKAMSTHLFLQRLKQIAQLGGGDEGRSPFPSVVLPAFPLSISASLSLLLEDSAGSFNCNRGINVGYCDSVLATFKSWEPDCCEFNTTFVLNIFLSSSVKPLYYRISD
ncbi:hypothetical protein GQX74_013996 [Glossina fuscipes]|nr:hypothetical protein GQX74_013996 [Glossina fuscipes]